MPEDDPPVDYATETLDVENEEFQEIFKRFLPHKPEFEPSSTDLPTVEPEPIPLSRKKQKKSCRMTVAELKAQVKSPEVVEYEDTTAPDPHFLILLKSQRNTIPVPIHWSQKRKYLAGKRGFLKAPYRLPDYIAATGVVEQRNAQLQRDEVSLKTKARAKLAPRLSATSLDYSKLHDAFFKYQRKPEFTNFGEIYFEGKEYELSRKEFKPGFLSQALRNALGMTPLAPPPWLYNQQRFGPAPSYPYLRVAGLSAPIPEGAQWGFHPGGWGKAPTDESGRPLYGDVFGLGLYCAATVIDDIDSKTLWGEPEVEEEVPLPPVEEED